MPVLQVLEESDIDKDGTINLSEFQHVISRSPDFVRYVASSSTRGPRSQPTLLLCWLWGSTYQSSKARTPLRSSFRNFLLHVLIYARAQHMHRAGCSQTTSCAARRC